jgi:hypothetical protein
MIQNVYTLLCERDMPMARITLPGILKFLQQGQTFFIFDDGSLTMSSVEELGKLSSNVIVKTRAEREEFILSILGDRPNCIKYRNDFPLGFKLLDIPLFAQAEKQQRFTYTDTDIIYLKNCEDYFTRGTNTYLRTDAIKISVRLQDVFFKYKWKVPYKFNSGYFSYDAAAFDLDFIEYYLGLENVRHMPWLSEQTCWALLFERTGVKLSCPAEEQFICREDYKAPTQEALAIHLIGNLKGKCAEWAAYEPDQSSPAAVKFEKSRNVTILDWIQKSTRRLLPSI